MGYSYSHTPLLLVALAHNDNDQCDQRDGILDTVLNHPSINQSVNVDFKVNDNV